MSPYGSDDASLPLKFLKQPFETKMYCEMGPEAYLFEKGNFTFNYHDVSISPETFKTDSKLSKFWDVTAVSYDSAGKEFVASIEAKDYPFMATQFHPEKTIGSWFPTSNFNHSWESIRLNRMFVDLFV